MKIANNINWYYNLANVWNNKALFLLECNLDTWFCVTFIKNDIKGHPWTDEVSMDSEITTSANVCTWLTKKCIWSQMQKKGTSI